MKFLFSNISKFKYILGIEYVIRFIILFCLILDVIFFFRLDLFYKSLSLLIIPLCLHFWLYNIKDWSNNKENLKEKLIVTSKDVGTSKETHTVVFAPQYTDLNLDLKYHVEQYRNCLTAAEYLINLETYKSYYSPQFGLFYYFFYSTTLLVIIVFNIIFIY